tara:strand:- start:250 stop:936 length:687 start_codon:yes stop_codon:yes gene_type:complete
VQAIVLAGGLGTRLRTMVSDLPKPMAPIGERPFLSLLLDQLVEHGCTRTYLSVGYKAETIVAHFGADYRGMALDYVREDEPLGTGGGLRLALSAISEDRALVLNGDTYFDIDLATIYRRHVESGRPATLVLRRLEEADRYGTVTVQDDVITGFQAAGQTGPALINGGTYVLERRLFDGFDLPPVFSFEQDFLQPHVASLRPGAIVGDGLFVDIGVPQDYLWACAHLAA